MSSLKAPTPTQTDLKERASLLKRLWRAPACYRYWYGEALWNDEDYSYARSLARSKTWEMVKGG